MAYRRDSPKLSAETGSLLDQTLAAAVKDQQTVTSEGESLDCLIEGSVFREAPTHLDERGSVVELFDPRWQWHPDPLVFAYSFTIKPGFRPSAMQRKTSLCRKRPCLREGRADRHPAFQAEICGTIITESSAAKTHSDGITPGDRPRGVFQQNLPHAHITTAITVSGPTEGRLRAIRRAPAYAYRCP